MTETSFTLPGAEALETSISALSAALFLGPLTVRFPADTTTGPEAARALIKLARGLEQHYEARQFVESERAERDAARAVNNLRNPSPFGSVPVQHIAVDAPTSTGSDAA